ncbi:MAG: DUF455 family protein [Cyanobacteria bacterium P01_F01_bin.150]
MRPNTLFGDFTQKESSSSLTIGNEIDDSKLVKSLEFKDHRDLISSYIYSLLRTLEFEACWLISCQNSDFKVLLGKKMGFDARWLAELHSRMHEKLCLNYVPTVSAAYAQNFDSHTQLVEEGAIASFLYALSHDLYKHLDQYLATTDAIADEPTYLTLKMLRIEMEPHLIKLKQWRDQDIELHSLASVPEMPQWTPYSAEAAIPPIPEFPGRSANLQFNPKSIVNHKSYADLVADIEKLRRFSHYVYVDVEIAAMEVCAKNIAAYRAMPLDFKLDMARQIWDEARHAIVMRQLLENLGASEGDYTYSAKVWKKCEKGTCLAERLAIEQGFQEGNALESNFLLTESFKQANHLQMTSRMDYINADEAIHAKIGNFWMNYLLDGSYEAYQATMEKAAELMNITLSSNVAIERSARKIAGFPDQFVDLLAENNEVYGYRKS